LNSDNTISLYTNGQLAQVIDPSKNDDSMVGKLKGNHSVMYDRGTSELLRRALQYMMDGGEIRDF